MAELLGFEEDTAGGGDDGLKGETACGGDDTDDDGDGLKLGFSVERRPDGVVGDVSDGVERAVGPPLVC